MTSPKHDPAALANTNGQRRLMLSLALFTASLGLTSGQATSAHAEEEADGPGANPLVVDVPGLVVPIASGGQLVNYLFTGIRVVGANSQSAAQVRNSQFLARDVIIRASGRNPVPAGRTPGSYDAAAAAAMMKAAIEGGFRGVRLTSVQLRDPRLMRN